MIEEIRPNYTRISTILEPYNDYDSIPEEILGIAAERGTRIHGLCELYAREGIYMPSEYDGFTGAFKKWFDREVETVLETECRLYCETYEITGQFDLLVRLKTKQLFVVDIKTCVAKHKSWPLQVAAYSYLYAQKTGKNHTFYERAVVHLKKDGRYGFYEYPRRETDLDLFMSALKLHRYFKKG